MTKIEFNTFIEREIQGRWTKWQPSEAQLDDWWRILRYHTMDVAKEAIQQHRLDEKSTVFEPKIHAVAKLLRAARKPSGKAVEKARYEPWVRCIVAPAEYPDWEDQEWLWLEGGFRRSDVADKDYVTRFAQAAAAHITNIEGGRWCGVVRPEGQGSEESELTGRAAKQAAMEHALNGPRGAAHEYAKGQLRFADIGTVPPETPTESIGSMVDRMMTTPLPSTQGPVPFDAEDD